MSVQIEVLILFEGETSLTVTNADFVVLYHFAPWKPLKEQWFVQTLKMFWSGCRFE